MNLSEKYYMENLYPLQDGVLNIVKKFGIPFYLTGGTALSRGYFHHRYSDDLDLFVNQDARYPEYVQELFHQLEAAQAALKFSIDYQRVKTSENFTQFFVCKSIGQEEVTLKIDAVNDVAMHYGGFEEHAVLGRIDSWQNMLSNKITALFRFEAKDVADLWVLAKHCAFDWMTILEEARTKEAGIDPVVVYEILTSFPKDAVTTVKWSIPVTAERFTQDLIQIATDILHGRENRP